MTDMFNRALDSSDPLLSSMSLETKKKSRKRNLLSSDVLNLLQLPDLPTSSTESSDEDDDYETEIGVIVEDITLENEEVPRDDIDNV